MGIGGPALGVLSIAYGHGYLQGKNTVCELGNQELNRSHACYSMDFPFPDQPSEMRILDEQEAAAFAKLKAQDLYHRVGIDTYTSVDINGLDGAHVFDLTVDIRSTYGFEDTFDLVTNFGTTEHVCDQLMAYRNIHNLCATGGLMVGVVPFSCALNHGLFNVQPVFFEELAKANNYELIGLFYTIASESIYTWCPYPYSRKLLETLYAFIDYKLPSYGCEEQIGYIVKKTHDAEFQLPYQGTQVYHNKIGIDLEKTYENQNLGYLDSDYTMEDHIARYSSSRKARYHMFKRGDARSKLKMVANKFRHPGQILTLIKGKM